MPRAFFVVALTLLTIPSFAVAMMYSVAGNKPQSPANYQRWPGLVDVVNQSTRKQLVWCNGAEWFAYTGGTKSLNETLELFARIECPTHTVVLRPGRLHDNCDWELNIVEGVVRAGIEQHKMQLVRDLDPTLVIYVNDQLSLESIVLPRGVRMQQIGDLRARYLKAQRTGTDRTKSEAATYLKTLNEDPIRTSLGEKEYDAQLKRISNFINLTFRT